MEWYKFRVGSHLYLNSCYYILHSFGALVLIFCNIALKYYLSWLLGFLVPPLNFAPEVNASLVSPLSWPWEWGYHLLQTQRLRRACVFSEPREPACGQWQGGQEWVVQRTGLEGRQEPGLTGICGLCHSVILCDPL